MITGIVMFALRSRSSTEMPSIFGQHPVEDHRVERLAVDRGERVAAIGRDRHVVIEPAQFLGHRLREHGIVLDQQNVQAHHGLTRASTCPIVDRRAYKRLAASAGGYKRRPSPSGSVALVHAKARRREEMRRMGSRGDAETRRVLRDQRSPSSSPQDDERDARTARNTSASPRLRANKSSLRLRAFA